MLVFDIVVYLLLFVMTLIVLARYFIVFKGFIPLVSLTALLLVLVVFKTSLPKVFDHQINSFYITYNNFPEDIAPRKGTKVDIDLFMNQFYNDKTKDAFVEMDGYFVNFSSVKKELYIDNNWAKTEIYLDGKLLGSFGSVQQDMLLELSRGIHHLQIYIYNSELPPIMVHVGMNDYMPIISDENLTQELKKVMKGEDYDALFTTQNADKKIELTESQKPTLLFLNSTRAATYEIDNIKKANLKAIVYSGIGVRLQHREKIPTFRVGSMPALASLLPKDTQCMNRAPRGIICPSFNEVDILNSWMQRIAGKNADGFSDTAMEGQTAEVSVPLLRLDEQFYEKLQTYVKNRDIQKEDLNKRLQDPFYQYKNMRWFDALHVQESDIPNNAFVGYYLDKFDVPNVKFSEITPKITLQFGNKFHEIKAGDFLAYWVGDFLFVRPVTYIFSVAASSAKVKVLINKETVLATNKDGSFSYKFIPGKKYRIEVQYINDNRSADMHLDMQKSVK
ncbi:hypothetical protein KKA17_01365 [bacterium]|nr:hypothetical protein [bacterium]MBU1884391.1 hypothetical protein [bacterium]